MLPAKLDDIINTQDQLTNDMTALNVALATTPQGGNLDTVDLNQVEERLKALYDDKQALDTLPERARLEREFHSAGLDELVADLSNRGVPNDAVAGELQLAWWTTAFEDIVKSSAIISNQDAPPCKAPPTDSPRWMSNTCVPSDRWSPKSPYAVCATCFSPARRKPICCIPRLPVPETCR
mgnify:FL=1